MAPPSGVSRPLSLQRCRRCMFVSAIVKVHIRLLHRSSADFNGAIFQDREPREVALALSHTLHHILHDIKRGPHVELSFL